MSNRQKIEQQTNLLNAEWSRLRIQSIPLSTSSGAVASKKVCVWCAKESKIIAIATHNLTYHPTCTAQLCLHICAQAALA